MRLCTISIYVCMIAAGLLCLAACGRDWNRLEAEFDLRSGWQSYQMQERNFCSMTEDVAALMFNHPTLERLRARAFVARALYSCENVGLALPEDVDDFSEAIKLDPNYVRAYVYRGCALLHISSCVPSPFMSSETRATHRKQMIDDFKTAIELDPHGVPTAIAYNSLSLYYFYQLNQPQNAIDICSLAIANLPISEYQDRCRHYGLRAEAYGKLGQLENQNADIRAVKNLIANFEQVDWLGAIVWQSKKPALLATLLIALYAWSTRRRFRPSLIVM